MKQVRTERLFGRESSLKYTRHGISRYDWRDPYRLALTLRWPQFFAVLVTCYLLVNVIFAAMYALVPGCIDHVRPHVFSDDFFFSVETLGTVGYGTMSPATTYGHVIASLEVLAGLIVEAVTTGLIFVRFSRPRSRIVFSDLAVIGKDGPRPALMLRIGNGHSGPLVNVTARLTLLLLDQDPRSGNVRRLWDLALERSQLAMFPLTWNLFHYIEPGSPMHGLDEEALRRLDAKLILTISAHDPVVASNLFDGRDYPVDRMRFNHRYKSVVFIDENGFTSADLAALSEIEPLGEFEAAS